VPMAFLLLLAGCSADQPIPEQNSQTQPPSAPVEQTPVPEPTSEVTSPESMLTEETQKVTPPSATASFQKSEKYGFYGTLTLTGYLTQETHVCDPGNICQKTVNYASFVFSKSDSPAIYDFLQENTENSFLASASVGLGCYEKDKKRISSENDGDGGTVENIISGAELTKLLASSKTKQVQLQLTKSIETGGREAPDCYSYFRSFKVL